MNMNYVYMMESNYNNNKIQAYAERDALLPLLPPLQLDVPQEMVCVNTEKATKIIIKALSISKSFRNSDACGKKVYKLVSSLW